MQRKNSLACIVERDLDVRASDRTYERMREAILNAHEPSNTGGLAQRLIRAGRIRMGNPRTRLAAAAVIVTVFGLGILEFITTGSQAAVAWTGVAQKLSQVRDYVYRDRGIKSTGPRIPGFELKDEYETWWYYSAEFGHRWDQYHAQELIGQYYVLLKQQERVWIHPGDKTFFRRSEQLPQTTALDPAGEIRAILAEPYVKLGRTTIDGVLAEGIEVAGQKVGGPLLDEAVSRLWVNVATELPVWMETEGKVHGSQVYCRLVRDQFRWNVNLTEADFTPLLPADFVQKDWPTNSKPRAEQAPAQKTGEVDFQPLRELGLLDNDQARPQPVVTATGSEEIQAARDKVMDSWPKYADLRDSLQQELDQKIGLKVCPVDTLVRLGVLLREKYWDVGGDLAPTSYRYGYLARLMLETAHAREPDNLAVGDELAETIMATETMDKGPEFWEPLRELRTTQFQQVRAEVERGRRPVWEDYARVSDLVNLYHTPEERISVIDWLADRAPAGGWAAYASQLEWMRAHAAAGGLGYNIYRPTGSDYPEEFRYGSRLPSFRGPRRRAVVPSHPLQSESASQ